MNVTQIFQQTHEKIIQILCNNDFNEKSHCNKDKLTEDTRIRYVTITIEKLTL